ncbi:MAG: patatin-like phospholipase family protein [Pseudomonadota bacterium]
MARFVSSLRCIWFALGASALMLLSACTYIQHTPVPEALVNVAGVPQFTGIRSWADDLSPEFIEAVGTRHEQLRNSGLSNNSVYVLALSGGGENGAFGAGLLNGWSDSGTRPEFELVTGVSTGALIAPLAFLGREYDQALKGFYTGITTKDILIANPVGGLTGGSALASNEPLKKLISEIVDMNMLEQIAVEYERGRRLLVLTTNLEAQRPVVWNMGRIASYRMPEALDLFRNILLASAAIPAAFPPVALKVAADGKLYTELHVDGGTTVNDFVAPLNAKLPGDLQGRKEYLYTILNGRLSPEYEKVEPQTLKIGGRAIGTLLKYKNYADLRRLYLLAKQRGANFRMTSVPPSFTAKSKQPFDKVYMNKLYQVGYQMGLANNGWTADPDIF